VASSKQAVPSEDEKSLRTAGPRLCEFPPFLLCTRSLQKQFPLSQQHHSTPPSIPNFSTLKDTVARFQADTRILHLRSFDSLRPFPDLGKSLFLVPFASGSRCDWVREGRTAGETIACGSSDGEQGRGEEWWYQMHAALPEGFRARSTGLGTSPSF